MISLTKVTTMIIHLLSQNKTIYILLVLIVLSSCHSAKQVTCPEIDTDHPKTRRYKRDFSLAWNHSRKVSKKSVLIVPSAQIHAGDNYTDDMTLLVSKPGDEIISENSGFSDMEPVRSGELNTLVASQDESFTGPSEIIVFDGSANLGDSYNPPSKREVRKVSWEIRRDIKETFRSAEDRRFHPEDSIMLFAVTSFVLGIIGIFTMPLLLGLLATIFGALALGMIKRAGVHYGKGLATAGLIIGIILLVVGIILLPFAILGIFI